MIELHGWMTPNSRKLYYMLEDTDLEYRIHPVNISKDDQFKLEFLAISPNNKTPALVDPDGPGGATHAVFETSAMLIYLAEKAGRFLPDDPAKRSVTLQWLMWQTGGVSPMFGQAGHFRGLDDQAGNAYAVQRFTTEANRLFGVLDRRLAEADYLAGDDYTIADISTHPWMRVPDRQGVNAAHPAANPGNIHRTGNAGDQAERHPAPVQLFEADTEHQRQAEEGAAKRQHDDGR